MEAVIFIGIQASGKTTFYKQRFFNTHLRLSLDQLGTRHRERLLFASCLAGGTRFVIDNTNPSAAGRAEYIKPAHEAGFRVIGYYFQSKVHPCLERNSQRAGRQCIPERGIWGTAGRLERPRFAEGFDELYYVWINERDEFVVEPWRENG